VKGRRERRELSELKPVIDEILNG
jgi:hypothetical protein